MSDKDVSDKGMTDVNCVVPEKLNDRKYIT